MERLCVIKSGAAALTLPVTPEKFSVSRGINFEIINIHTLGDAAIAGYPTLATVKIDCMLPAHDYPFNTAGAVTSPYYYVERLTAWCGERTALRYVVTGTGINLPVKIESVEYGEQDGTNDVYASITLREQRTLTAEQTSVTDTGENRGRPDPEAVAGEQAYTVASGDTLGYICRKFYGDTSLYARLAEYNGIKNVNLIYPGDALKIPPKDKLPALPSGTAVGGSGAVLKKGRVEYKGGTLV